MESILLSGLSSYSSTTTLRQLPSTKLQPSDFGSHSPTKIRNSVSFKSWTSGSLDVSFKRIEHVTNKVRCGTVEPVVRKKKMAVFVSGGGSNFKSIHEACVRGSILGEIVVLVTNNPGKAVEAYFRYSQTMACHTVREISLKEHQLFFLVAGGSKYWTDDIINYLVGKCHMLLYIDQDLHDCGGAEYARSKEIPIILFPRTKVAADGLSASDVVTALRSFDVDFVLLAGYLKLIPTELVQAYSRRIVNIHPSLLPAFGGKGYYGMKVHKAVIASGARYSGPTIHFVDEHYDTGCILAQRTVPVFVDDTAEVLAARVLKEEHHLYVEVVEAICEERICWREDGVPIIRSRENPEKYS